MRTRLLALAVCVAPFLFLSTSAEAWGPKLEVDEDTWIQLGFLGQFWGQASEGVAGVDQDQWGPEFYTRRARLMGVGSVHPKVRFFFSTDVPNTGRAGAANTIIWNDAFVDFQLRPELKIAFGRVIPPFSIESKGSAATLLGIDYNVGLIKFPSPSERAAWRDDGVEVRGVLFDGILDYRASMTRGNRAAEMNPDWWPRLSGMLVVNLQDAQPAWFYNHNSLGALDVISLGGGFDVISHTADDVEFGIAWSAFLLVEQGIAGGRLNAMAGYYNWDGDGWAGGFQGYTTGVQVGYLLPWEYAGRWQPVVRYQRQDDSREGGIAFNTFNLGLNYLLKGHSANLKLDYAINDRADAAGNTFDALRLQAQLLF